MLVVDQDHYFYNSGVTKSCYGAVPWGLFNRPTVCVSAILLYIAYATKSA